MNTRSMTKKVHLKIEEEIGLNWEQQLMEEIISAGQCEREIGMRKNQFRESVPWCTVIADGEWGKRSHGHMITMQTMGARLLLVRDKTCTFCGS